MEAKHITLPPKELVVRVLLDKSKQILKKAGIRNGIQEDSDSVLRKEGPTKPKS